MLMTLITARVSKLCFPQITRCCQVSFSRSSNFEQTSRFFSLSATVMSKKVALVLAGCGVYDGTELHEASACMVHLSREGAEVTTFAPDKPQMHTVNHHTGTPEESKECRNVLVESARIVRGPVKDIKTLKAADFSAVVFPGGFGAAKNLSDFAVKKKDCTVDEAVERVITEFKNAKKPIGLCCISPVLAAKCIKGCEVTIGSDEGTAGAINAMGGKHVVKKVNECHVDQTHKVVTTPAYMCSDAKIHEIHDGIGTMIKAVVEMA